MGKKLLVKEWWDTDCKYCDGNRILEYIQKTKCSLEHLKYRCPKCGKEWQEENKQIYTLEYLIKRRSK